MRGWCPRPRSSLSTPAPPPVRRSRPLSQDPVRPEPTDGPREAAPSDRVRVRRKPDRGHYEKEIVDAILDAGLVAHVGFVVDGQPYVIPTLYWRDGEHLQAFLKDSADPAKTKVYLDKWVYGVKNHEEYVNLVGKDRLGQLESEIGGR